MNLNTVSPECATQGCCLACRFDDCACECHDGERFLRDLAEDGLEEDDFDTDDKYDESIGAYMIASENC